MTLIKLKQTCISMFRYFIILVLFIVVALPSKAAQEAADSTAVTQPADSLSRTLDEVVVEAETIKRDGNHDIITITREMRKNAHNTAQLLEKIPGMYLDRKNNSLKYNGTGKIVILMDSVEKDDSYIKQLNHIRFDRIDVIRNPSGRYAEYDLLINLHTKEDYEGYDGNVYSYANIRPSYRKGYAFADGYTAPSITYTKNRWNFSVNPIYMFYRNETDSYTSSQYLLNNLEDRSIPNADGSPTKRTYWKRWSMDVSLDYQFNKNHSLSMRYYVSFADADNYSRSTFVNGPLDKSAPADTVVMRNVFRDNGQYHKWGLFYTGRVKGWGIWLGANYIHNPWKVKDRTDRTSGFEVVNDMRQQLNHTWVNLDVDRSFFDGKMSVNFGYEDNWRKYHAWCLDTDASLTSSVERRHRWYASLSYRISQSTMFRINGGMTFADNRSGQIRDSQTLYSLGAYFSQDFKDGFIDVRYNRGVSNPSAQQMRDYGQFTDTLTWSGGNPLLKSVETNNVQVQVSWKRFFLRASCDITPTKIVDIVDARTGILPNGINGDYYAFQPQNTYYRGWKVDSGWYKNFGGFTPQVEVGWSDYYASFKDYSHHENGLTLRGGLSYDYTPHNLYMNISYTHNSTPSVMPQSYSRGCSDKFEIYVSKIWLNGALTTTLWYKLPVHFADGKMNDWKRTPVLVQHTYSNPQKLEDNFVCLQITYRFSGGKSVRRYRRTLYGGN